MLETSSRWPLLSPPTIPLASSPQLPTIFERSNSYSRSFSKLAQNSPTSPSTTTATLVDDNSSYFSLITAKSSLNHISPSKPTSELSKVVAHGSFSRPHSPRQESPSVYPSRQPLSTTRSPRYHSSSSSRIPFQMSNSCSLALPPKPYLHPISPLSHFSPFSLDDSPFCSTSPESSFHPSHPRLRAILESRQSSIKAGAQTITKGRDGDRDILIISEASTGTWKRVCTCSPEYEDSETTSEDSD